MRVLIADDSEVIVQRLMALLAHVRGVEVVDQVGTVEETREAVRRLRPDAVILDMQMPGGSGIDVLEILRKTHPVTELPIIMATARDGSSDVVQALALGANS